MQDLDALEKKKKDEEYAKVKEKIENLKANFKMYQEVLDEEKWDQLSDFGETSKVYSELEIEDINKDQSVEGQEENKTSSQKESDGESKDEDKDDGGFGTLESIGEEAEESDMNESEVFTKAIQRTEENINMEKGEEIMQEMKNILPQKDVRQSASSMKNEVKDVRQVAQSEKGGSNPGELELKKDVKVDENRVTVLNHVNDRVVEIKSLKSFEEKVNHIKTEVSCVNDKKSNGTKMNNSYLPELQQE